MRVRANYYVGFSGSITQGLYIIYLSLYQISASAAEDSDFINTD